MVLACKILTRWCQHGVEPDLYYWLKLGYHWYSDINIYVWKHFVYLTLIVLNLSVILLTQYFHFFVHAFMKKHLYWLIYNSQIFLTIKYQYQHQSESNTVQCDIHIFTFVVQQLDSCWFNSLLVLGLCQSFHKQDTEAWSASCFCVWSMSVCVCVDECFNVIHCVPSPLLWSINPTHTDISMIFFQRLT